MLQGQDALQRGRRSRGRQPLNSSTHGRPQSVASEQDPMAARPTLQVHCINLAYVNFAVWLVPMFLQDSDLEITDV